MQIHIFILFINIQFWCVCVHLKAVHPNNKNTRSGMNYPNSRNLQSKLNDLNENDDDDGVPVFHNSNFRNIANKEEEDLLFNDNIVGIVISPHTKKIIGILEKSSDVSNNDQNEKNDISPEEYDTFVPYNPQSNNLNSVLPRKKYTFENHNNQFDGRLSIDTKNDYADNVVKKRSNGNQHLHKENYLFNSRENDLSDYESGHITNRNRLQKRYTSKENDNKINLDKHQQAINKENNNNNDGSKVKNEKIKSLGPQSQNNKENINGKNNVATKSTNFDKKKRELNYFKNNEQNKGESETNFKRKLKSEKNNLVTKSVRLNGKHELLDTQKSMFGDNKDGVISSTFESDNQDKHEEINKDKKQKTHENDYDYQDGEPPDRQLITLSEEENSDINPDFIIDSSNLESHIRERRNFPNFVRHRRSNALLPYQQSAFIPYHGTGDDVEDDDGNEFDDDGLDDRTTNLVEKRETEGTADGNDDYYNSQNTYNSHANYDNDQIDNYNVFEDYLPSKINNQQKRNSFSRYVNDEVSNNNYYRNKRYRNLKQLYPKPFNREYANRYGNKRLT